MDYIIFKYWFIASVIQRRSRSPVCMYPIPLWVAIWDIIYLNLYIYGGTTESFFFFFAEVFVAVGNQIELWTDKGHSQLNLGTFNATALVALAVDPSSRQLFFSDAKHATGHIFSTYLNQQDEESSKQHLAVVQNVTKSTWILISKNSSLLLVI